MKQTHSKLRKILGQLHSGLTRHSDRHLTRRALGKLVPGLVLPPPAEQEPGNLHEALESDASRMYFTERDSAQYKAFKVLTSIIKRVAIVTRD